MARYQVKVKYGNPGGPLNTTQTITVDADDQQTAMHLAINKFKASNSSNRNKEALAIEAKKV